MDDIKNKVEKTISEIRGLLMADGGDLELVDVIDNVVKVRLKGACAGCPGAQITLQWMVEKKIKEMVPEIIRVESV